MRFHKNSEKRTAALSMDASSRLNYQYKARDERIMQNMTDRVSFIAPGETATVFEVFGYGSLSTIFISLKEQGYNISESARIHIYTDGEKNPSIDCILSDFFMSGYEGKINISDYAGKNKSKDGLVTTFYRHIFIPYNKSCRIDIVNTTTSSIEDLVASVYYCKGERPVDFGRYSKAYSCEKKGRARVWGETVVLFETEGKGAIHSMQFSMKNPLTRGMYMEGNIEIYIDNNEFPEYQSTGTEEFFMGGVYFTNLHTSAFSGCTRTFNDGSENHDNICSAHRYFIEDPITFERHIKILWHNGQPKQGQVHGPTEFDFSGIYYLEKPFEGETLPIVSENAQYMMSELDGDRYILPLHGKSVDAFKANEGENLLASFDGEGVLETIYLNLNNPSAVSQALISFEIDGRRTDKVPLDLFFLNTFDGAAQISRFAGRTSKSSFFKQISIQYSKELKIYVDMVDDAILNAYFEYRCGRPYAAFAYDVRVYSGTDKEIMLSNLDSGDGRIEGIVFRSEKLSPDTYIEFYRGDYMPLIVDKLSSFFLSPEDFGMETGVSSEVGILSNGEAGYAAYRLFHESSFTYMDGIHMRIVRDTECPIEVAVFIRKTMDCGSARKSLEVTNLYERLNLIDFTAGDYEGRCYNPIESGGNPDNIVSAGETALMFEDFGAGMIKAIRFGTPPDGTALHESLFKIYLNGSETPAIDTTFGRFFSADFDDPLFWSSTRFLARLSKRGGENPRNERQHSSFFRYINIPYQKGIKFTLTAPSDSRVSGFDNVYYSSAKGSPSSFGMFDNTVCVSKEITVIPNEKVCLASTDGCGGVTSIQLMVNGLSHEYLNAILEIFIDGKDIPIIKTPLYCYFFGAHPSVNDFEISNSYNDFWREILEKEDAYFSGAEVGWIKRSRKAPFKDTMYRLLDRNPIIFNNGISIYITNVDGNEATFKSDIIIRKNN